jgi:hypothetical protein
MQIVVDILQPYNEVQCSPVNVIIPKLSAEPWGFINDFWWSTDKYHIYAITIELTNSIAQALRKADD